LPLLRLQLAQARLEPVVRTRDPGVGRQPRVELAELSPKLRLAGARFREPEAQRLELRRRRLEFLGDAAGDRMALAEGAQRLLRRGTPLSPQRQLFLEELVDLRLPCDVQVAVDVQLA